jgi:hypothetical protein
MDRSDEGCAESMKNPQKFENIKLDVTIMLATIERLLTDKPAGWYNVVVRLNNNLVGYLRGNGPIPNWTPYPLARDWFSQNVTLLKEQVK